MTPLTPSELARCRKDLATILEMGPERMTNAAALWASLWGERLLITAEPRFRQPWNTLHKEPPPPADEGGVTYQGWFWPWEKRPPRLTTTGEDDALAGGRG